MKLSSISISIVIGLALGCGILDASAQRSTPDNATQTTNSTTNHPTTANKSKTINQRFNPIYGSEKEANDLLSFIAANMVLELDDAAVKNVDGIVIMSFVLDSTGNIDRPKIVKSLRGWIDYALIGAIKRMPSYGKPSQRNNGKIYESQHSVVFSFGSYVRVGEHTYGFQGDKVSSNTQAEIDRQRNEAIAKLKAHNNMWNKFTDKNAKLEYDTKNGLKNQAGTLAPDNQLGVPDDLPPRMPTVSITHKD